MQTRVNQLLVISRVFFLPTILLMLNLVDMLSTNYGLSLGLTEINPLYSNVAVLGKMFGCCILFAVCYVQYRWQTNTKKINNIILGLLILFYVGVVINNFTAIISF